MDILIVGPCAVLVLLALGGSLRVLKQLSARKAVPSRLWLENFSVDRYRAMQRLFSEEDVRFVRQNGIDVRRFNAERRRLCRQYLYAMGRDYSRISSALQVSLAAASTDRSAEISALAAARLRFQVRVLLTLVELRLQSVGLSNVRVDGLLSSLDALRIEYRTASAAA